VAEHELSDAVARCAERLEMGIDLGGGDFLVDPDLETEHGRGIGGDAHEAGRRAIEIAPTAGSS